MEVSDEWQEPFKEQMRATVINILESAKEIGAKSIAMPAISVGLMNFPIEKSCQIIIEEIIKWSLLQE